MRFQESLAPPQVGERQHALGRLVYSRSRAARALRLAIVALGIALGLAYLRVALASLLPPNLYHRDFIAVYILAKTIAHRADPTVLIGVLAERYLGAVPHSFDPIPTPHPPTMGNLFLPFALLDYPTASAVWFGAEIICLVASVHLLGRASGVRLSAWWTFAIAVSLLAWHPFWYELLAGQVMLLVLMLLAGARLALLSGRPVLGGVLLGLTVVVKQILWPLLLLLALRKDWRALIGSASTILLGYAVASWTIGPDRIIVYFSQAAPRAADFYKATLMNISAWTIGWRLFSGTKAPDNTWIVAPPLISCASAALIVSAGLPVVVLLIALLAVRRQRSLDTSLGVMICVSILVSPIAWTHYLVLTLIPAAQVVHWLIRHRLPSRETNTALLVAILLLLTGSWLRLSFVVASHMPVASGDFAIGFAPGLFALGTTLSVGALGWLVATLGAAEMDEQATPRAR